MLLSGRQFTSSITRISTDGPYRLPEYMQGFIVYHRRTGDEKEICYSRARWGFRLWASIFGVVFSSCPGFLSYERRGDSHRNFWTRGQRRGETYFLTGDWRNLEGELLGKPKNLGQILEVWSRVEVGHPLGRKWDVVTAYGKKLKENFENFWKNVLEFEKNFGKVLKCRQRNWGAPFQTACCPKSTTTMLDRGRYLLHVTVEGDILINSKNDSWLYKVWLKSCRADLQ